VFVGDILDDIIVKADFVTGPVGVNAYSYFSAKKGYQFFQSADVSAFVAPKWGTFRVGMLFMDAQAVTDDVGYPNGVAGVKDLSFYAKASVSY
jgi:hypothetical protein